MIYKENINVNIIITHFLVGLAMGAICSKLKMPKIIGMLITGIVLGPYVLDFFDPTILSISSELRKIALIIILLKAGLSLVLISILLPRNCYTMPSSLSAN